MIRCACGLEVQLREIAGQLISWCPVHRLAWIPVLAYVREVVRP